VRRVLVVGCLAGVLVVPSSLSAAGKRLEGVVNLNTASAELLLLLPGLGPAKVETILLYRKRHAFRTVDELGRVKGIGRKMLKELRAHLAVAGPSTASVVRVKTDLDALKHLEGAGGAEVAALAPGDPAGARGAAPAKGAAAAARGRPVSRGAGAGRARLAWRNEIMPCLGPH